jgi:hypothetical protein
MKGENHEREPISGRAEEEIEKHVSWLLGNQIRFE